MRHRLCCLVIALHFVCGAAAQQPDSEYYPYAEREERTPVLLTDSTLFYRAVQSAPDLYGEATNFNLPAVVVKRRGQEFGHEDASIAGLKLPYRYFSTLRLLGSAEYHRPGLATTPDAVGCSGGIRTFRFTDNVPLMPYRASVNFTDRNYLVGAKIAAPQAWGSGWSSILSLDARTGRDMHVEGVFTQALTAGFRVAKRFNDRHELSALLIAPFSMRGTRLSSTDEALTRTGDRLYNPAWGFQDGKVRNARVRREAVPFLLVSYRGQLWPATSMTICFGAEAGVQKYSSLGWYNARTPLPDNYRYMPSYTGDRETELAWAANDARYTQIDWDGLIAQNRMAATEAVYTLEDRAERLVALRGAVRFSTRIDEQLSLHYSLVFSHTATRNYKQMRDLLGADHLVDIDQYIVDDDTYGNLQQNDLRHPNRIVREGDRFGYDYAMLTREVGIQLHAEYRADRLRADVAFAFGDATICRRGYYEKELFPDRQSYGRSRQMRFTPYTIKALAGWAFSPRNYLEIAAMAATLLPEAEDLFYQPQYNNRTTDDLVPERHYGAEINYRLTGAIVDLQLAAYAVASFDEVQSQRYFDDLAGVFCDMTVAGIGKLSYGFEAATTARLSYRWSLSLAAAAGRFKHIRNPHLTILSDVDNTAVDTHAESYMGGCQLGGTPQITVCAGVSYFGAKGWIARASAGYAGGRYVDAMPLRRTERVARQGGVTEEAFDQFIRQERLEDAFTLDCSLCKIFNFDRSRLTIVLMLRNLLGDRDTVYGGYESARIRRLRAGDATLWQPQDTRYTYAYPRSFYLTATYKF